MTKATTPNVANTDTTDRYNVIEATRALIAKGDKYGWATKAAFAHILATEIVDGKVKRGVAASLAKDTGYHKAELSRIARVLIDSTKARKAALALNVLTIDDNDATLAEAVKVGELFKRIKATPTAKATTTDKADSETVESGKVATAKPVTDDVDVLALVDSWLRSATDSQYAARMALVENLLANIAAERATAESEVEAA